MASITRRSFLLTSSTLALWGRRPAAQAGRALPKRLRRAESFLGIHFDFHAGPDCTEIGKRTTREMIEAIIGQVGPDYIQIDCKGHRGLSSYPTRVGNPAPGFVGDQLRLWRTVTAEHGVGLFMHYSGVLDQEAVTKHPDWASIDASGKRDAQATSVFGPYVDRLLIPQLEELIDIYGVDGVWVDGDCWGAKVDYSPAAIEAWRRQTSGADAPRAAADPQMFEFTQFCREGFRRYVRHYVDTVHQHEPAFQIASNWSWSHFMPEAVSANVDWLSGDYSERDSVNSARLAARYLSMQGKSWDLMAWSFAGPAERRAQSEVGAAAAARGGGGARARRRVPGVLHAAA